MPGNSAHGRNFVCALIAQVKITISSNRQSECSRSAAATEKGTEAVDCVNVLLHLCGWTWSEQSHPPLLEIGSNETNVSIRVRVQIHLRERERERRRRWSAIIWHAITTSCTTAFFLPIPIHMMRCPKGIPHSDNARTRFAH